MLEFRIFYFLDVSTHTRKYAEEMECRHDPTSLKLGFEKSY